MLENGGKRQRSSATKPLIKRPGCEFSTKSSLHSPRPEECSNHAFPVASSPAAASVRHSPLLCPSQTHQHTHTNGSQRPPQLFFYLLANEFHSQFGNSWVRPRKKIDSSLDRYRRLQQASLQACARPSARPRSSLSVSATRSKHLPVGTLNAARGNAHEQAYTCNMSSTDAESSEYSSSLFFLRKDRTGVNRIRRREAVQRNSAGREPQTANCR